MKVVDCKVGGIYRFISNGTNPPKYKFHLCISRAQFFVFNSKSIWASSFRIIRDSHHAFLNYDSYIGCGQPMGEHFDREIPDDAFLCFLSRPVTEELIRYLSDVRDLYQYEREQIIENLKDFLNRRA